MDVQTSQRPGPLLNGFSANGGDNSDAQAGPADPEVLIDFDPIPASAAAAAEVAPGKVESSSELLIGSFDHVPAPTENIIALDEPIVNEAVTANGDSAENHVPDDLLSAPLPTTNDNQPEETPKVVTSGDKEVGSEAAQEEPAAAAAAGGKKPEIAADPKPKPKSGGASPRRAPAAAAGDEGAKPKAATQKSAPVTPKPSSAGGPATSVAKKTPSSAVTRSTPAASSSATVGTRPASTTSASAGAKVSPSPASASSVKKPPATSKAVAAAAEGHTPATTNSPRRTPKSALAAPSESRPRGRHVYSGDSVHV